MRRHHRVLICLTTHWSGLTWRIMFVFPHILHFLFEEPVIPPSDPHYYYYYVVASPLLEVVKT